MRLLRREEVERLLDPDELVDALVPAFVRWSDGEASVPARVAARTPQGFLGTMPGYLPGAGLAVKLVSVFPGNHDRGVPSHQGLVALFDAETGTPVAVMDAIRITALRTAAAAAVAARALARRDAATLAVLGAGAQGDSHLEVLPRIRDFRQVRLASRTREHAEALARRHPDVAVVPSFEEAVRGADVVCCCTDAREPILEHGWLARGAHVSSVGGSSGRELDGETVRRGRVFVEWRGAAVQPPPAGAAELQGLEPESVTELGELFAGRRPGRDDEEEITVYKSTGHALEDVVAARLVLDAAERRGVGRLVEV